MSLTRLAQFVYQNLSYDISHQDRAASKRTDRDEIDWKLNAYAIKTLQMFVHANPLTEVIGLGQLETLQQRAAAGDRGCNLKRN